MRDPKLSKAFTKEIGEIKKKHRLESGFAFQYAITQQAKKKTKAEIRKEIEDFLALQPAPTNL